MCICGAHDVHVRVFHIRFTCDVHMRCMCDVHMSCTCDWHMRCTCAVLM